MDSDSLDPAQLLALSREQLTQLSVSQIAALPTQALAALPATSIAALRPHQIAALTTTQVQQGLSCAQLSALTTAQVRTGLSTDQLVALTPTQIKQGLTSTQLMAMTTAQVRALDSVDIPNLKAGQVLSLTTMPIGAMAGGAAVGVPSGHIQPTATLPPRPALPPAIALPVTQASTPLRIKWSNPGDETVFMPRQRSGRLCEASDPSDPSDGSYESDRNGSGNDGYRMMALTAEADIWEEEGTIPPNPVPAPVGMGGMEVGAAWFQVKETPDLLPQLNFPQSALPDHAMLGAPS